MYIKEGFCVNLSKISISTFTSRRKQAAWSSLNMGYFRLGVNGKVRYLEWPCTNGWPEALTLAPFCTHVACWSHMGASDFKKDLWSKWDWSYTWSYGFIQWLFVPRYTTEHCWATKIDIEMLLLISGKLFAG